MFRILIVEDETPKLKHIMQTLEQVPELIEFVESVVDANSAKLKLQKRAYDLLILDISIPLRKSQDVDPHGGVKLLEEILARDKFKIPVHIIGLTAYEVYESTKQKFDDSFLTLVSYNVSDDSWREHLLNGVKQRMAAKEDLKHFDDDFDYDAAFVCGIRPELDALRENGWQWTRLPSTNDDTIFYQAILLSDSGRQLRIVAACATKMGMPNCAALSMKIITRFRPRYIIMTGIMAGIEGRVLLGDIVFADPVWDWGSGKWVPNFVDDENSQNKLNNQNYEDSKGSIFKIDPYQFNLSTNIQREVTILSEDKEYLFRLRSQFRGDNKPKHDINIHLGAVASGAAVLSDKDIVARIMDQHRKLLGIEMEAYALFCAAEIAPTPKPTAYCVKSVVDFGDIKKSDDFQFFGSYASAQVAKSILEKLLEIRK
jgi:nucleoside phosphorylase/CheY-like chemotaxis protein